MESQLPQSGLNAVGSNNRNVCTAQSVNTLRYYHTTSYDVVVMTTTKWLTLRWTRLWWWCCWVKKIPEIGGLEPVGLGQCQKRRAAVGGSPPRFSPATASQILYVGDHWICVSNVFSSRPSEVYVYDTQDGWGVCRHLSRGRPKQWSRRRRRLRIDSSLHRLTETAVAFTAVCYFCVYIDEY